MSTLPTLPGFDLIVAMLTSQHSFAYQAADVVVVEHGAASQAGRNTYIDIDFQAGPFNGQIRRLFYNRLDLEVLFNQQTVSYPDTEDFVSTHDFLSVLNDDFNLALSTEDLIDVEIDIVSYPQAVVVQAAPTSLVVVGQFSVTLTGASGGEIYLTDEEGRFVVDEFGKKITVPSGE